jgi:hypothetical protein
MRQFFVVCTEVKDMAVKIVDKRKCTGGSELGSSLYEWHKHKFSFRPMCCN